MQATEFKKFSPCDYADALPREQFVSHQIRPLYQGMARIAGPAYTVLCPPGDHLMLHAAIYQAKPGDVIVARGDSDYALAGGNVCAIAKSRGIAGFVIDGLIRDLAEVREMGFAVFARGVIPKPGAKKQLGSLQQSIGCGGVMVHPNDIVIADEEGIAIVPQADAEVAFNKAKARAESDASLSLEQWQAGHQQKVQQALDKLGWLQA